MGSVVFRMFVVIVVGSSCIWRYRWLGWVLCCVGWCRYGLFVWCLSVCGFCLFGCCNWDILVCLYC